jgi:hypothetical protein
VTGLTDAHDWFDRCKTLVDFVSGNFRVRVDWSCGPAGQFLACLELVF